MRNTTAKFVIFLLAVSVTSFGFVVFDAGALAQNANTSMQEENTNANTNRRGNRRNRGRSSRRTRAENMNTGDATGSETTTDAATDATSMAQDAGSSVAQSTGGGAQEDLSGTYTGTIRMTGGHDMSGDATLTITGNNFTLSVGDMSHTGRIYAVNTRKYIGAALYFNDISDPASNTPLAVSARARRRGNSFRLEAVPGTRNRLTFNGRSSS